MNRILAWLNGWRLDLDGWYVRARRDGDPSELAPEHGFVEEAGIAVRTAAIARDVDSGVFGNV